MGIVFSICSRVIAWRNMEAKVLASAARPADAGGGAELYAHVVEGTVERYDWPGFHGFNFILNGSLSGGVASLRYEP